MKIASLIITFFCVFVAYAEKCSGFKPLVQPGCQIECREGTYVQNCVNQACGPKPVPSLGCRVGECVEGSWKIECDCGLKPIPTMGCTITECKDGAWQEDCSNKKCSSMKPLAAPDCKVECEEGTWKQKCN